MKDRKESTRKALENYITRECAPKNSRQPKKKYNKPERQTENDCLIWCRSKNIFVHVVESSSYDPIVGRKTFSRATPGMPDLIGNTANGNSVYIELKAKQRRSTLKEHQREFLIAKIKQNCFAVVVDRVEKLDQYFREFCKLKNLEMRQTYLLDCLPQKTGSRNTSLGRDDFEKQHGF